MKVFTATLALIAVTLAAPEADAQAAPALAERTLNTRVGAFSAEACYGDWCETKRKVHFIGSQRSKPY